jgi:hypothetical protein
MDTELQKVKFDAKVASGIILGVVLTDYLRIRLHEWYEFGQPLALALGIFLAWTISLVLFGPGRLGRRRYMMVLILLSLAAYLVGRIGHF